MSVAANRYGRLKNRCSTGKANLKKQENKKMTDVNITTEEAAECLRVLQEAPEPIVAAGLAARLRLSGSRETQRRHVRAIIEYLRDAGSWIVATNRDGYSLTADTRAWRNYQEHRQNNAKHTLGVTHKRKRMLAGGRGQGILFDTRRRCGVATRGTE